MTSELHKIESVIEFYNSGDPNSLFHRYPNNPLKGSTRAYNIDKTAYLTVYNREEGVILLQRFEGGPDLHERRGVNRTITGLRQAIRDRDLGRPGSGGGSFTSHDAGTTSSPDEDKELSRILEEIELQARHCTTLAEQIYSDIKDIDITFHTTLANRMLISPVHVPSFASQPVGVVKHKHFAITQDPKRCKGYSNACFAMVVTPTYAGRMERSGKFVKVRISEVVGFLDEGQFKPASAMALAYTLLQEDLVRLNGEEDRQRAQNLLAKLDAVP